MGKVKDNRRVTIFIDPQLHNDTKAIGSKMGIHDYSDVVTEALEIFKRQHK